MGWNDRLLNVLTTTHYPVTFGATEPVCLNRWLALAVKRDPSDGWFSAPALPAEARTILQFETAGMPVHEQERNWRCYRSDNYEVDLMPNVPAQLFVPEPGKFAYMACCVYATTETDLLLYVNTYYPSPIRIWFDGEPVLAASHGYVVRDTLLRVRCRAGFNTVLVEAPLELQEPMRVREFIIRLQPLERLTDRRQRYEFIDYRMLDDLVDSLSIYPERVVAAPGERIQAIVLPAYRRAFADQPIRLTLERMDGERVLAFVADSSRPFAFCMPEEARGVLRLQAAGLRNGARARPVHLLCGDYADERERLERRLAERYGEEAEPTVSLREHTRLPESFRSLQQYTPGVVYDEILRRMGAATACLDASPQGSDRVDSPGMAEVFGPRYAVYRSKRTGDGPAVYEVMLPPDYDERRSYPLILYFHDAQGRTYPTELPWAERYRFDEAIIVHLVGIGRLNGVDDANTVRLIGDILGSLPVDRDRVYGLGFCTGALKAYRIGMAVPDLFAGIASVIGDIRLDVLRPQVEWLDNLSNTEVIGLCSDKNWLFNTARKLRFLEQMARSTAHVYGGFMHNEFNLYHNSRPLLRRLLTVRRERVPREVHLTVLEPAFSKAYWVKVERICRLEAAARIHAELTPSGGIEVECANVDRFRLLLSREEMGLASRMRLQVNGRTSSVTLPDYAEATVELGAEGVMVALRSLDGAAYRQAYDELAVDEGQMGIKRLYLQACLVVKPARRTSLSAKLSYLLQNPIKDRYIPYAYPVCEETAFAWEDAANRNVAALVDVRSVGDRAGELLELAGASLEDGGLRWRGFVIDGNYFALLPFAHPTFEEGLGLLVLFSSESAGKELTNLLNAFDEHPYFYEQAILYDNGRYHVLREAPTAAAAMGGTL